jgi:hypothetical protein
MIVFVLGLTIAFPLAWFISEFQSRQWLRCLLGCCSIAMTFGVAWLAGSLQALNYNAWYSDASLTLVDKTLSELSAGHESHVIDNLKWFKSEYHPNYETGLINYQRLVDTYVKRFEKSKE